MPRRALGLGLAATAAALWAIGGIAAEELFTHHNVDPGWLVGVRMASGGLLLLAVLRPAWPRRRGWLLIAVAVFGIAGAQYTWFAAIDRSNVAFATFVQYSAVAMTAAWQMLRRQVRPTPRRLAAVAAAGAGVWLLAAGAPGGMRTAGGAHQDQAAAVGFALVSAVAFSFYMLGSARLANDTDPGSATAWGLCIGSVPLLARFPPWTAHPAGDPLTIVALMAVVAVGATAIAFSLSLASLRHLTPTEFAVTSTLEPALAAVAAAILLGVALRPPQYLGGALTIAAVLLLALAGQEQREAPVLGQDLGARGGRAGLLGGPVGVGQLDNLEVVAVRVKDGAEPRATALAVLKRRDPAHAQFVEPAGGFLRVRDVQVDDHPARLGRAVRHVVPLVDKQADLTEPQESVDVRAHPERALVPVAQPGRVGACQQDAPDRGRRCHDASR